MPLAVLSKSQILSRKSSPFGKLLKASGIQKDKIGNNGKKKKKKKGSGLKSWKTG